MKYRDYALYEVAKYTNIREMLEESAQKYQDTIMFEYLRDNQLVQKTYNQFLQEVNCLGAWLLKQEYQKDNIVIFGNNSYEWLLSFFAITITGNVAVPIDKSLTGKEVSKLINHSQSKLVFYSDEYLPVIEDIKLSTNESVRYISMSKIHNIIEIKFDSIEKYHYLLKDIKISDDDLALMIYTSGTTGDSKGVMLSHKNITTNALKSLQLFDIPPKTMLILPLHHLFSLAANLFISIIKGGTIYINESLKNIKRDLMYSKPQYISVVPMIIENFYNEININLKKQKKLRVFKIMLCLSKILRIIKIDIRKKLFHKIIEAFGGNLNIIICGGAKLDSKYIKWFDSIGIKISCGYGLSECSPVISVVRNKHFSLESVGTILPNIEVKIINPNKNGVGEICVKGDIVFKGYYKNNTLTQNAFIDGWFRTGDLGYIDKYKMITITGRLKNLIISSNGENVSPEELEQKIYELPYVKETLVYVKDNKIVAEVLFQIQTDKDYSKIINADIIKINKELPTYKNISEIVIRKEEFPKTSTMKIKRSYT